MVARVALAGSLVLALVLGTVLPGQLARADTQSFAATLTILSAPVDVSAAGSPFTAASDGLALQSGDSVRAGTGGLALLTFFDGSETQVLGNSQVQVFATSSGGTSSLGVYQALGTTINRIHPQAAGDRFETVTPTATGVVRGTTYIVSVRRVQPLAAPSPTVAVPTVAAAPSPDVQEQVAAAFPRSVPDSPYLLTGEADYLDSGALWRVRSWLDPETGETWNTFDPAPDGEQVASSVGIAPLAQATGSPVQVCAPADPLCITAVILLSDPGGHVGRVDVQPGTAGLGNLVLNQSGDVGGTAIGSEIKGGLTGAALAAYLADTLDLTDPSAAQRNLQRLQQLLDEVGNALNGNAAPGLQLIVQLFQTPTPPGGGASSPPGPGSNNGQGSPPISNPSSNTNSSGGGGGSSNASTQSTDTPTATPTATNTPAPGDTATPTATATNTPAPTATNTPGVSSTSGPTDTPVPTPTGTPTVTPVPTATNTATPTSSGQGNGPPPSVLPTASPVLTRFTTPTSTPTP